MKRGSMRRGISENYNGLIYPANGELCITGDWDGLWDLCLTYNLGKFYMMENLGTGHWCNYFHTGIISNVSLGILCSEYFATARVHNITLCRWSEKSTVPYMK